MEAARELSIVLRAVRFEERSQMVTALTENRGRITAMAKNSVHSRRFGGSLETFATSRWDFRVPAHSEVCKIDKTELLHAFDGLRNDFEKLSIASFFNELILRVSLTHENSSELFKLHFNGLKTLDELTTHPVFLINAYILKVLKWSGLQPQLTQCQNCKTRPRVAEVEGRVESAAWICPDCGGNRESAFWLSLLSLADGHRFLSEPIRKAHEIALDTEKHHQKLLDYLVGLLFFHVPGLEKTPPKSLKFLNLRSTLQPQPESLR